MITAKNVLLHEFIGLECKVVAAANKSNVGLQGKIVDEHMKSIVIESSDKKKMIMKKGTTFQMKLEKETVEVKGDLLVARPEDRLKKRISKW